jgi:hypothetical protein
MAKSHIKFCHRLLKRKVSNVFSNHKTMIANSYFILLKNRVVLLMRK